MIDRRGDRLGKVLVCVHAVTIQHRGRATRSIERKVGITDNTAARHRRGGGREVTVTSKLHTQESIDQREGWVLLKRPRCDIDGLGEEQ